MNRNTGGKFSGNYTIIIDCVNSCLKYHAPAQIKEAGGEQLLTIEQAADFLHLAKPTIYGLVSQSKIPCMKKGKKLYFSKAELIAWLQQGKRKTITELQEDAENHLINKRKRG